MFLLLASRGRPKSDISHSAKTVCATESKAGLSAEKRNRKWIVTGPTRL